MENLRNDRSLDKTRLSRLGEEALARIESGVHEDNVRDWAYARLEAPFSEKDVLEWCHGLASLWIFALADMDFFPDLESRFTTKLEEAVQMIRTSSKDASDVEKNALWFQAELLRFFWETAGTGSDAEISQIERLGKSVLKQCEADPHYQSFLSQLALPPSVVVQDWSTLQESWFRPLELASPPGLKKSTSVGSGKKLTRVLSERWSH